MCNQRSVPLLVAYAPPPQITDTLSFLQDILFTVNVQHDCFKHDCALTSTRARIQERQTTALRSTVVKHTEDTDYILNIFVLHHYDELSALVDPAYLRPATTRTKDERIAIRLGAAEVLHAQISSREKTKGAVHQARSTAKNRGETGVENVQLSLSVEGGEVDRLGLDGPGQQHGAHGACATMPLRTRKRKPQDSSSLMSAPAPKTARVQHEQAQ